MDIGFAAPTLTRSRSLKHQDSGRASHTLVQPRRSAKHQQLQRSKQRPRRYLPGRRTPPPLRAQHLEDILSPAAEQVEQLHLDLLTAQRSALGARVVRHLAGEQSADLRDAIHLLPVHVEAPRAWHTLEAGLAEHGSSALHAALAPRRYPIPSFHTLAHCRCQLASAPSGRRFRARHLNSCLALVFEQLPAAAALAGLPSVALNRYDLHHGHLFFDPGSARLGLLLHAKEYPARHAEAFDVHLGNCQAASENELPFEHRAMDTRNYLWLGGRLACLDVAAPVLQPLLMPGLELPRTVLESDLGQLLADVHYFAELGPGRKSAERVFVCLPGSD